MANKTIPELTEKLQLEPSDLLIVHGSGQTKKTNFYNALSLSAKNVTGSTKHISEWLSDVNDNTLKIVLLSANNTGIDTEVRALTSNWQSTYTNYTSNSSSYTTNSTVNSISSQLVLTSDFNNYKTNVASTTATLLPTTIYKSASGDWQSTYTTVRTNSAFWASNIDTGVRTLTGNWESTYNTFKNLSSTFLTSETDSQTLSFNETTKDLSISNGNTVSLSALIDVDGTGIDTEVRALTSNWQSTYTTVLNNSATTWNYQGTDLKALSANWQNTYTVVQTNSATWVLEDFIVACSDETTNLTITTSAVTFRVPFGMYLNSVRASVNVAPVGSTIIVDVKQTGTSIFSTKLSIDANEETSTTAATPAVISNPTLTDDAKIVVSIDQIGSTTAGKGLKLTFKGYRV